MPNKKILLPDLGEGVTEGELVKWLVAKGDSINSDQVIAEVMTDKASIEVPSPVSGTVLSLLVKEGESIAVSHPLLELDSKESELEKANLADLSESKPQKLKQQAVSASSHTLDSHLKATPLARRLAKNLGVDLAQIKGTGSKARVLKQDILKQQASFKAPGHGDDIVPFIGIRKKIADRMQLSKKVIPHFTIIESAGVKELDSMKESVKEMLGDQDIKITYLSFVMKALWKMAVQFPTLNACIQEEEAKIIFKKNYHFGFAVDTPKGLLVPVVQDVANKSLKEIALSIQELALKARDGSIQLHEMQGGTATITNIGSIGGRFATPIINPPEVCILGMYRTFIQPKWNGQNFKPQKTMNFSLTCDHRLIDGAEAARAIQFFIRLIEQPLQLFI